MKEISDTIKMQEEVSAMLWWGTVLSVAWLLGVGSFFAFIYGLKAAKIIIRSKGQIKGIRRTLWCIVAGALGMYPVLRFVTLAIKNSL